MIRLVIKFGMISVLTGSFLVSTLTLAAEVKLPVPQQETLPNGLKIVWFVDQKLPVVDMAMMVESGFRDDPKGKAGTAELVSSLLDRGAGGLDAQQIARSVEMLGATRYSSVDDDSFTVGMHGLAGDALPLLELLGKMVVHPSFPEGEVKREHSRLLDRWNHIGDHSQTLASLAYHRATAGGTEYGRGSFLSSREFKNVKRDDITAFHQSHFTPKNSVLMIVGRVDQKAFREKINAVFGKWGGDKPARSRVKYQDPLFDVKKGEILVVDRPGLTQAQVRIGFRTPLIQSPRAYALAVTNALVGEYFDSRLNSVIRDELGLTYSIGSSISYAKELARFSIASSTRNESVGPLVQKTFSILKDVKAGKISKEEVITAKEYLVGGYPLSVATTGAVAARWLASYIFDLGPDYLNEYVPRVSAVVHEQVLESAAKDLDLSAAVIVIAGDGKEIVKSLMKSGYKSIRQVKASELL